MKPVLKFSYYAGTFGGYDRGAVRKRSEVPNGSRRSATTSNSPRVSARCAAVTTCPDS